MNVITKSGGASTNEAESYLNFLEELNRDFKTDFSRLEQEYIRFFFILVLCIMVYRFAQMLM